MLDRRKSFRPPARRTRRGYLAFTSEHFDDRLVASVKSSTCDLPGLLEALSRALISEARLASLELELNGMRVLRLERRRRDLASTWETAVHHTGPRDLALHRRATGFLPISIMFAGQEIGMLRSQLQDPRDLDGPLPVLLSHFAQQCGRLTKRYQLESWSQDRWGLPLRLVGLSRALRDLDRFIEIAAWSDLPVAVRGEFGTEKLPLATAIHCCGPRAAGPFVQIDCAHPRGTPADWFAAADGGTLFLADIDELAPSLQSAIPQHLPSRLAQWPHTRSAGDIRVIASTTADLRARAAQGRFSRAIAAELDFLSVTVPPLRERPEDIDALICNTITRLGLPVEIKRTDVLVEACMAYDWPENAAEIGRVVARLATMTGSSPIVRADIERHAPHMALHALLAPAARIGAERTEEPTLDEWAARATRPGGRDFDDLPSPLRLALAHLGRCYDQPTTLADLATLAGTSSSQLSASFRAVVGAPFKTLLRHIRILKARERLTADPAASVTDVAFEVGYADLSFFERSFRRIVGQSPREYRGRIRRVGAGLQAPSDSSARSADPAE